MVLEKRRSERVPVVVVVGIGDDIGEVLGRYSGGPATHAQEEIPRPRPSTLKPHMQNATKPLENIIATMLTTNLPGSSQTVSLSLYAQEIE